MLIEMQQGAAEFVKFEFFVERSASQFVGIEGQEFLEIVGVGRE